MTNASDLAVSAVLHQRVDEELAPISYYCRLLNVAERYSTYETGCSAVIFSYKKCPTYLVHKKFEDHCQNVLLYSLLKRVKDVGRLGKWILRLAPIKFRVKHTRGVDNVVADGLSRIF